jgi:hypothetical protein
VNRVPHCFERESHEPSDAESPEDPTQSAWHWFAVGLLVFCWVAEASMCADRGF